MCSSPSIRSRSPSCRLVLLAVCVMWLTSFSLSGTVVFPATAPTVIVNSGVTVYATVSLIYCSIGCAHLCVADQVRLTQLPAVGEILSLSAPSLPGLVFSTVSWTAASALDQQLGITVHACCLRAVSK